MEPQHTMWIILHGCERFNLQRKVPTLCTFIIAQVFRPPCQMVCKAFLALDESTPWINWIITWISLTGHFFRIRRWFILAHICSDWQCENLIFCYYLSLQNGTSSYPSFHCKGKLIDLVKAFLKKELW